jgi:hypothetical protein
MGRAINQHRRNMNKLEVFSFSDYISVRYLAHGVKDGNSRSICRAAEMMSNLVSVVADEKSVIIPMPGRNGVATYTKALAEKISEITMVRCLDCLRSKPHISQYVRKIKYGVEGMSLLDFSVEDIPDDVVPILIDNVLDTGTTAMSAVRALNRPAILVVLGNTNNYRLYDYKINVFARSLALLN